MAAALAAALLPAAGCSRPGSELPNIVVVVLDTVRDDVAELAEGHVGDPMPAMNSLGRDGTVFSNAWSTAPWTLPSHASLLTGLLPSEHLCTGRNPQLAAEHRTIAEYLNEAGYEAAAFFSNPWLTDLMSGMMRGFETRYVESRGDDRIHHMDGSQGGITSNSNIASWLRGRDSDRPFLLFVNYLEAHLPYDPAKEYREAHALDLAPGDVVTTQWAYEFNAGMRAPEEVNWERIHRLYVGDASTADALLGELMGMLKDHGLYDEAVIIVTSDHGENLGDHGLMDHHFGVFETLLAVPLVVRAPELLPPGMRDDPVMLTDIFPAVLEAAGIADPPELSHAHSVFGPPSHPDRPIIAEYAGSNTALVDQLSMLNPELDTSSMRIAYATVRVGNLRLTVGSDGSHELTDFATDPDEMADLQNEGRAIAGAMKACLPTVGAPAGNIEIDEEMKEELRALGYLP
ncbi:MAG: sulfatase [Candidatus Eisenbacteria bacterium]